MDIPPQKRLSGYETDVNPVLELLNIEMKVESISDLRALVDFIRDNPSALPDNEELYLLISVIGNMHMFEAFQVDEQAYHALWWELCGGMELSKFRRVKHTLRFHKDKLGSRSSRSKSLR
jgi:hypothetical protein